MDEIFEQMLSASSWGDGVSSAIMDTIGPLQNFSKMMPHSQEQLFDAHQEHLQLSSARGLARRLAESNAMEGPAYRQSAQALNLMGEPWQESFVGNTRPSVSQGRPGSLTSIGDGMSNDVHLGKRGRSEDEFSMSIDAEPQGNGEQAQSAITNGAVKPRVRARRGQATDPHSIAERNRRERIAERMKALQELVPDSNKTDKASMLDEIINYVKFLQMQVKCLSMCRLGGAGVAAPLLADLPAEGAANFIAANLAQANGAAVASQEGLAFAERQVARLMDEDMSAAMQYLQSKGLCLMPISLATAISSSGGARQQQAIPSKSNDASRDEKQAMELQALAASSGASLSSKDLDVKCTLVKNNLAKASKEKLQDDGESCDKLGHGFPPPSSNTGAAMKEDSQR